MKIKRYHFSPGMETPMIRRFNRDFFSESQEFTFIGDGELGGKAQGLAFVSEQICSRFRAEEGVDAKVSFSVDIPRLTVITTDYFQRFMEQNDLYTIALSGADDERIANYFLRAELPPDLLGDLRALIRVVRRPLAIRSSSLLEDSLEEPFAGIYQTKMIPNNQPDIDTRFRKLIEAIKFVYASTFFENARSYIQSTPHRIEDEKMAVIIQEVVGLDHNHRFYPDISGVARSYSFYPISGAQPGDGVVNLALGLGKTIVDGGNAWTFSPRYPDISPPYNSIKDLLKQTQLDFWAVHMGKPFNPEPFKETEYLVKLSLKEAEYDDTIRFIASTYDPYDDRITVGTGNTGPRVINFAPLLQLNLIPLNQWIKSVLDVCTEAFATDVEIEFAITIENTPAKKRNVRFGLVQVRPMAVFNETVDLEPGCWERDSVLMAADNVMGNGENLSIKDILYVVPETFNLNYSPDIAVEIAAFNRELVKRGDHYLLIGFGRWGSSDSHLGIPVNWGQISGSRVIIESHLPGIHIDLSQGSHFFHNISNHGILYFSLTGNESFPIDWHWLKKQTITGEGKYTRCVHLDSPLTVRVDGRQRKGVIWK